VLAKRPAPGGRSEDRSMTRTGASGLVRQGLPVGAGCRDPVRPTPNAAKRTSAWAAILDPVALR